MYEYGVTTTSLPPDSFVPTQPARFRWEFICAGLGRIFRPPRFYYHYVTDCRNWRWWLQHPWKSLTAPFRGYRLAFQWDRIPKRKTYEQLFRGFTLYRLCWVWDEDDDRPRRSVEKAVAGWGWIYYWDCHAK